MRLMYIVLQFGNLWGIYDAEIGSVRTLQEPQVSRIIAIFGNILGRGILNVFQFQKINPNRLLSMPPSGYVIVRVGSMWTIYEGGKPTPRILEEKEVGDLTDIFPKMADQQMLNALAIDSYNPVKLLNLAPKPPLSPNRRDLSQLTTAQF